MRNRALILSMVVALLAACVHSKENIQTHQVRVETSPEGAYVSRIDNTGTQSLGPGPVDAEVRYAVTELDVSPVVWLGPIITGVLTIAGIGLIASSNGDFGPLFGGVMLSGFAGTGFLVSLPVAVAISTQDGDVVREGYPGDKPPEFRASLPGHSEASFILPGDAPPSNDVIKLALHPMGAGVPASASSPDPTISGPGSPFNASNGDRPIVAVFEIQDVGRKLSSDLTGPLTEYLSAKIAERGRFRVVPDADLRRQLSESKQKSYEACIDEACQIEVGKAVAAQKSLSTKIIRVGRQCALSTTLFDLKTEATETAASVRTPCSQESLMDGIDALVKKLLP